MLDQGSGWYPSGGNVCMWVVHGASRVCAEEDPWDALHHIPLAPLSLQQKPWWGSGQLEGTQRRISLWFVFRAITFTRTDLFLQCIHVKFCVKQQIMEIILVPITLVAAYLECSIQFWAHHYQAKIEKPETIQRAAKMILELKRLIYEERWWTKYI